MSAALRDALRAGLDARAGFLERCAAEGTDCYRLLHGVAERLPGVTVDRYGSIVLVQTWREPLDPGDVGVVAEVVAPALTALPDAPTPAPVVVWNHRGDARAGPGTGRGDEVFARRDPAPGLAGLPAEPLGHEAGLAHRVTPRHRGFDPLLFVDLRAGRRRVREHVAAEPGGSVLNLFAYTCGVGLAAAAAGAGEVWNVDFARSALEVGERNVALNAALTGGGRADVQRFVHEDVFAVTRQLAGLSVKGRRGRLPPHGRFEARTFDLVVLDPPRWAKSAFGVVDLVRDYASVFKPALLATRPGGALLVTNHVARVEAEVWTDGLRRSAEKAGRPLEAVTLVEPDEDVPSFDGRHPLKMAWLRVGG